MGDFGPGVESLMPTCGDNGEIVVGQGTSPMLVMVRHLEIKDKCSVNPFQHTENLQQTTLYKNMKNHHI